MPSCTNEGQHYKDSTPDTITNYYLNGFLPQLRRGHNDKMQYKIKVILNTQPKFIMSQTYSSLVLLRKKLKKLSTL